MNFTKVATEVIPSLIQGLGVTLQVTVISLLIAIVLGLASCLFGISKVKPLKWISKIYVWIVRGTPFIVQLFIIYFGIPQLIQSLGLDFKMSSFTAAVITLSINAGAYMSEIFRSGIQAIDVGQMEAARSLGFSKSKSMLRIILPQAFKICLPTLCNQFIITLKDSSLAQIIGLNEMLYQGKMYVGRTMESFSTYIIIGLFYLVIITILSYLIRILERRLNNGK